MPKHYGSNSIEVRIAYIHGRLDAQIETFAPAIGLSAAELAFRLGSLLCAKADGEVLGTNDPVSDLRNAPAAGDSVPRTLALASSSHGSSARSGASKVSNHAGLNKSGDMRGMNQARKSARRPAKAAGHAGYWDAMTPDQRRAEMVRRMESRKHLRPQDKKLLQNLRSKVGTKAKAGGARPQGSQHSTAMKSFWDRMTEEERVTEGRRRRDVAEQNRKRKVEAEKKRRQRLNKRTESATEVRPVVPTMKVPPKPRFSAAGLNRLRDVAKTRWAEKKKLGLPGSRLPAAPPAAS